MEYSFNKIEQKWQDYWRSKKTYKVEVDESKPKFYVLDMFPYPSGAGLHVGHPLGYIASDIFSRYKRQCGFNVLHPMGYDAYGLPAEQYAIQTGQHPAITTEKNITRYRQQLDKIGFSFDWNREVRTSDPLYYKWTQWAFIQMFEHWFDNNEQKARSIEDLIKVFVSEGNVNINAACSTTEIFSAEEWKNKSEKQQQEILLDYRIAYLADTLVNWCAELGTVLANDEVKDGVSVRGGYAVVQKKMRQWSLRVSAYAERLLNDMNHLQWSDSLKEIQRNWIGKSVGASVHFNIDGHQHALEVFTTRPDTLYGATFMVLAPEHEWVREITTDDNKEEIEKYIKWTSARSERERIADAKSITGVFTGAYGINPLTKEKLPIWIADYVLMGYGTGAIMAVPAHDGRDFAFAKHFKLPIKQVVAAKDEATTHPDTWQESYDAKDGILINSDIINGLDVSDAIAKIIDYLNDNNLGTKRINYRLRDAIFSRQRYWGEPFPVYYKDEMPYMLSIDKLPLQLPKVDKYLPTEDGQPPLGRAKDWQTDEGYPLELNTMPGFAGSSAYYLRYMDPNNNNELVSNEANAYWQDVDLYVGGTEHATGHLIYARFWNKFLFDIGAVVKDEPFKKLINQGMIQGRSNFVYRIKGENKYVSYNLHKQYDVTPIHVDVNIVTNDVLDLEAFRQWRPEFNDAEFILEEGRYICGYAVEKMSKSMFNVVNPDDIIDVYGADTLRLYEMFLGPVEQSKPWDTKGIDGVHRFLKKFWRMYFEGENLVLVDAPATNDELKVLHKTLQKVGEDIERFSFNTAISAFMICVNELADLKCHKREILEPLTIALSSFAPHIAEELWQVAGHDNTIVDEVFPKVDEKFLKQDEIEYPVSFNGKTRFKIKLPSDASKQEVETVILANEQTQKYLENKTPKKVIVVPGRIVNIVI